MQEEQENQLNQLVLKMFDETVYAYEIALAEMEFFSLYGSEINIPFELLTEGVIEVPNIDSQQNRILIERLAYYEKVGREFTHQKYLTEVQGAIVGSHAKAYMTHWIYPYKGKFHPQMIRALLNIIGAKRGDVLLDPMTGSGTLNVESRLLGIDSIGIDALPIGVLASKVKCFALDSDFGKFLEEVDTQRVIGDRLVTHTNQIPEAVLEGIENPQVQDFFRLLYFETVSISKLPKRKFHEVWKKISGYYVRTVEQSIEIIEKLGIELGNAQIQLGDARSLELKDESVNHIITSPPYAIAIDYVVRNTDQLGMMGYSTKEIYDKTIGLRGKGGARISNYYSDLDKSIHEMFRVMKRGGYCVILIGDTQFEKQTLPTISKAIWYAESAGFKLVHNIPKVSAGRFGLFRTERILMFQKL